jgi:tryptophan 2,3-dioxygenase
VNAITTLDADAAPDASHKPEDGQPSPAPVDVPRGVEALLDTLYARYLGLETIFDLQVARTGAVELHHPEEVLFRSVHMSSELWLRLAGYELERAGALLDGDRTALAARLIRRAEASVRMVIEATGLLETMPAPEYHEFRTQLGEASGLQSPGYAYLRHTCRELSRKLDAAVGDDDALYDLYLHHRDDPRYDVCEALLDLDAGLDRFRARHLQIARRFLGETIAGTGGTTGIPYLRNNLGHQLFPRLWELRDRIARESGATAHGYGTPRDA